MISDVPDWKKISLIAKDYAKINSNYTLIIERAVASSTIDEIDLTELLKTDIGANFISIEIASIVLLNRSKDPARQKNTTQLMIGNWISDVGVQKFEGLDKIIVPPDQVQIIGSKSEYGLATITKFTSNYLKIHNSHGAAAFYQIAFLGKLKEKQ